jgi:hypothetical protein
VRPAEVRQAWQTIRQIDGWFSSEAARLFGLLDAVQARPVS